MAIVNTGTSYMVYEAVWNTQSWSAQPRGCVYLCVLALNILILRPYSDRGGCRPSTLHTHCGETANKSSRDCIIRSAGGGLSFSDRTGMTDIEYTNQIHISYKHPPSWLS